MMMRKNINIACVSGTSTLAGFVPSLTVFFCCDWGDWRSKVHRARRDNRGHLLLFIPWYVIIMLIAFDTPVKLLLNQQSFPPADRSSIPTSFFGQCRAGISTVILLQYVRLICTYSSYVLHYYYGTYSEDPVGCLPRDCPYLLLLLLCTYTAAATAAALLVCV